MPTLISHPAPIIAASIALGSQTIPPRLLLAGLFFSVLPDFDSIGFYIGIPYENIWGHRGLTHSLAMVVLSGLIGFLAAPFLHSKRWIAAMVLSGAVLSHILLDAMTTGGLGVAFLWPFEDTRFFLPFRPIRVSPISIRAFLNGRGGPVLLSELIWVWVPVMLFAFICFFARRKKAT